MSWMNEDRIQARGMCPLLTNAQHGAYDVGCMGSKCAWWCVTHNKDSHDVEMRCAVTSMVAALGSMPSTWQRG